MAEISFLRTLQRLLGIPAREVPPVDVTRLQGRSDWTGTAKDHAAQMARVIDPHFPNVPAWVEAAGTSIETDDGGADLVAPWDRVIRPRGYPPASHKPDPWPATDDPYAKPEPCEIVPDPALGTISGYTERTNENTRRLAERGLSGRPFDSVKSVTDLLHLIERQEAAELHLRNIGMVWERGRGWYLP